MAHINPELVDNATGEKGIAGLRYHARRTALAGLAIVASVGFFAGTLIGPEPTATPTSLKRHPPGR